jgi:hypothetical protein
LRVSIFLEGNADAGPGSLEAEEGVEPAGERLVQALDLGGDRGGGLLRGGGGDHEWRWPERERMLRGWLFWPKRGNGRRLRRCDSTLRGPPRAQR